MTPITGRFSETPETRYDPFSNSESSGLAPRAGGAIALEMVHQGGGALLVKQEGVRRAVLMGAPDHGGRPAAAFTKVIASYVRGTYLREKLREKWGQD